MSTWPPDAWKNGGGTVWGWVAYDPELDLIYHGTGNPGPWNSDQRPGRQQVDERASSPATRTRAQARWAYQSTPARPVRLGRHQREASCSTSRRQGQPRKVLVQPERNGHLYMIDRATGEVLSADPYGYVNATTGVDLKTGQLQRTSPTSRPQVGKVVRDICPTAPGRQGLEPLRLLAPHRAALHPPQQPVHGLAGAGDELHRRHPYVGAEVRMKPGPGGQSRRVHRVGLRRRASRPG